MHKRGFTLIELLTVVAIIGILSTIATASFGTARMKARDGRRVAEIKQIQLALEVYFERNGEYPSALNQTPDIATDLDQEYMTVVPKDLQTGSQYRYAYFLNTSSKRSNYHLGADLEDKDNSELANDVDFDSNVAGWLPLLGRFNGGGVGGINGENPAFPFVYDVKP